VDVNKLVQLDIHEDGSLKIENFKNLTERDFDHSKSDLEEILLEEPVKY
jgi:hypothetical protein